MRSTDTPNTYLLITDGEFALCLLVLVREGLELQNRLCLGDLDTELHIGLGVFVTRLQVISLGVDVGVARNIRRPLCRREAKPASRSMPCASPGHFPQRTGHNLKHN